jgi:hypothetical protein
MRAAGTAMLGLAVLSVAACGDPRRGDVQVLWTFNGQNCQQAGVNVIQIDVANEVLSPNRYFCIDPNDASLMRTGADLGPFLFGTYDLTLTGFDADGTIVFQASQSFIVRGDVSVNVDLQRVGSTVASADLSWDALNSTGGFAPGVNGAMTCDEAQVDTVRIAVDPNPDGTGGTSAGDVACNTSGVEGAVVSPLSPGAHSFAILGIRNTSGGPVIVYATTRSVSARFDTGLTTNVDVDADALAPASGSATLSWDFSGTGSTCPGNVTYTVKDPSGTVSQPVTVSCTSTVSLPNVTAGLWLVHATSGAFTTDVLFGVPNQSTASWSIPFSH